jgi:hypothetical protein
MNNLIFITLIVLLLWYFYHLAQKTSFHPDLSPPPKPPHSEPSPRTVNCPGPDQFPSNQTITYEPGPETLISPGAKTPPLTSNEDQKDLEATLDLLLEEMREFDKSLD